MISDVFKLSNGARFYRADLHNHTPRDAAFHCGQMPVDTEEQKLAFACEYVRFARLDQNLDIIGITEHNDVSWLPYIQQAANDLNKELEQDGSRERLIVMPGVELGALNSGKRPIHLLAIFNPSTSSNWIDDFISTLDLMPDARFQDDRKPTAVQKTFSELCQAIAKKDGIVIAAHISSKSGMFYDLEGAGRIEAYNCEKLWAVEIPNKVEDLADAEKRIVRGEADLYGSKKVACLNHSDGRGLKEVQKDRLPIGSRSTRIKLSNVSVEGLRQAFIDFESRIRLDGEVKEAKYPQIIGVEIEGGFLKGKPDPADADALRDLFRLHLNPNLNAVIGGRGVGKSALIESIRHAFDIVPKSKDTRDQVDRLTNIALRSGGKVTIYYQMDDGKVYRIERILHQTARVYDEQTGNEINIAPKDLLPDSLPVQIYSQKEIYEISNDLGAQLSLLDNYLSAHLKPIKESQEELLRALKNNADEIGRLNDDVEDAKQKIEKLPSILFEIDRLKQRDALQQFNLHEQYRREERLLEDAADIVGRLEEEVRQFLNEHPPLAKDRLGEHLRQTLPHANLLERQAMLIGEIDQLLAQRLEGLITEVKLVWAKGEEDRAKWKAEFHKTQAEYFALLREFNDVSAEKLTDLNHQKDALEAIQREVGKREARIVELKRWREEALANLRKIRLEQLYPLRREKSLELSHRLKESLRINVICEGRREEYEAFLKEVFAGTGIREGVIRDLAFAQDSSGDYLDAIDLVRAIRKEQIGVDEPQSDLAQIYKVSGPFRKRLAVLSDNVLYRIEAYEIPDRIDIRLKVGDQYRPLVTTSPTDFGLSTGQRCTAILSLILVEQNTPLIIDQPEDDLDNQFVFESIVPTLRREKEQRQFLIATHNANLPVSGDAEHIIVLAADEKSGWIEQHGSIDDSSLRKPVEDILEGGRDAFRIRKEKYGLPD